MKAAREEQSDEAREAAREADKRGKQAARAEQSDEARKAAREENKRGKKEARERLRELQKSNYAEEEAAVAKERQRDWLRQRDCEQKQGRPVAVNWMLLFATQLSCM